MAPDQSIRQVIRATLVTDGSSDRVLLPILRWLIGRLTAEPVELVWFDPRRTPMPTRDLGDRIRAAVVSYPCQVLLVHRDAEGPVSDGRHHEIRRANDTTLAHIGIVPVRMTEAWLLFDEGAIREASGRPRGREPLSLPKMSAVEREANPKAVLHDSLRAASGARGRRAKRFDPARSVHRLVELIHDWSPLRRLSAFRQLERDTRMALASLGISLLDDG